MCMEVYWNYLCIWIKALNQKFSLFRFVLRLFHKMLAFLVFSTSLFNSGSGNSSLRELSSFHQKQEAKDRYHFFNLCSSQDCYKVLIFVKCFFFASTSSIGANPLTWVLGLSFTICLFFVLWLFLTLFSLLPSFNPKEVK